ncbi:MAG: acyltransferase 3 [Gemmatimonadetes bacterium]|nr:acyltransferase 3 [Gemmatimonadota bacterium]
MKQAGPSAAYVAAAPVVPGGAAYVGESGLVGTVGEPTDARVPSLDGLRAVAIVLVIMHNAGSVQGAFDGIGLRVWGVISNAGWVGVQLFFALSGFLITRILLWGKGEPGWLRSFYVRRLLRIVPLYYAFLLLVFLVAPRVAVLQSLARGGTAAPGWYWLYLANWSQPFLDGPHGLPHVWSLCVEEQFYLLWPVIIALSSERAIAWIAGGTVIGAVVARLGLHAFLPQAVAASAAYTWTICRADTIALGALVALGLRNRGMNAWMRTHLRTALVVAAVVALLALGIQHGFPPEETLGEAVNQPLAGILSALVVMACVCGDRTDAQRGRTQVAFQRVLSARWLRSIGKYSYAIYVLHLPVHILLSGTFHGMMVRGSGGTRFFAHAGYTALVLGVSYVLALVTWNLLEQPFLSLKRFFPMPARQGNIGTRRLGPDHPRRD